MDDELSRFLDHSTSDVIEEAVWGDQMRLRITAYLCQDVPPLSYTTSARAVVVRNGSVLVQQDRDSRHILPGGRLEENELPEAALRREIGEETGWWLGRVEIIGFMHLLHLIPKPREYQYPYPSFLQAVFAADAIEYSPVLLIEDGYEIGSELLPVPAVRRMELTPKETMYLDAALLLDGFAP